MIGTNFIVLSESTVAVVAWMIIAPFGVRGAATAPVISGSVLSPGGGGC